MFTTQILIQNNLNQIKHTLDSLEGIDCEFIFGNLGSTDGTAEICKEYGKVIDIKYPRHQARNKLIELSNTDWQFYIDPGEVLSSGHDLFNLSGLPKRIYIVSDDLIIKEIRLWKKNDCQFINPFFEYLNTTNVDNANIFIAGTDQPNQLESLLNWKQESPQLSDVDYYLASQYLALKDYKNFSVCANRFLFREHTNNQPTIMMRYYLAQVELHVNRNVHESVKNLLFCLSAKPLMSEFWCCLGDCFYRAGVIEKAIEFFNTAIIMGKNRPTEDSYPLEISKYNDYPNKMMELCTNISKTTFPYH